LTSNAQDSSLFLKVHFLYGSKPLRKYRDVEPKWFGGILGGHVGIQGTGDSIASFTPKGSFHVFAHKRDRHSLYTEHSIDGFYSIMGGSPDSMKKTIVYIPVTRRQMEEFDSITHAYFHHTPYDYALFGMRCSASAYEILAKLDLLPSHSYRHTYWMIFYPAKLRKRLLKKALQTHWRIDHWTGSTHRKWEKDRILQPCATCSFPPSSP
jgi:hypothetical protein